MRRPRSRWLACLAAGLLLLIAAPNLPGQSKPSDAFKVGSEVFRRILYDRGFRALHGFEPIAEDPKHSILIVFGNADCLADIPGGLPNFIANGGALFLATDKKLSRAAANALGKTTGVRVSENPVACEDKDSCFRKLDYCPFLQPAEGANPDLFRLLVSPKSSLSTVASNVPSYLEPAPFFADKPPLSTLAFLPPDDTLAGGLTRSLSGIPALPLFAVGGDVGDGRVLVLADHSIFINEMMLPTDNGNVEFTYNCLQWLRGPSTRNGRNTVLFVENGKINSFFEVPIRDGPDELTKRLLGYLREHPDEAAKLALTVAMQHPKETAKFAYDSANAADKTAQKLAPEAEQKLREVEERNGPNTSLLQGFGEPNRLLRGLVVWLAVLVVLYGCYKIGWKARHRTGSQGEVLSSALRRLAPTDSVVEQRRRDLIRGNNLWEPAHDLAQQSLASFGLPSTVPPRIVVQGGWLRRWTMTSRVRRLWRLANGPPARISLREWQRVLREVQKLKTALATGAVRFQG